jgi:hypothetical protein
MPWDFMSSKYQKDTRYQEGQIMHLDHELRQQGKQYIPFTAGNEFYTVNWYILCIYDFFHILPSL